MLRPISISALYFHLPCGKVLAGNTGYTVQDALSVEQSVISHHRRQIRLESKLQLRYVKRRLERWYNLVGGDVLQLFAQRLRTQPEVISEEEL